MTYNNSTSYKVIAMVLAGGKGERLSPLTLSRSKPGVSFGGKYKIIDFVLSNFFNSNIKNVYILTQYKSYLLNKHIRDFWDKWTGWEEHFEPISPETNSRGEEWFKGTADAINHYLRFIEDSDADFVAVFGGDHIYKMDIRQMIDFHMRSQADISIAALEVPKEEASRFGVFTVDETSRVLEFAEKPTEPKTIPGQDVCFASMGNYIFSRQKLIDVIKEGKKLYADLDFGKHIIPMMLKAGDQVYAYNFNENHIPDMTLEEKGYWKDVGTLDSYYEANMDLIAVSPQLNLHNYKWPILTKPSNLPPAKTVFDDHDRRGVAVDSYICGGVVVSGGVVRRSILSQRCRVNSYSLVEDCILLEGVVIGRYAKIRKAIIDEGVNIPDGAVIGYDEDADRRAGYTITKNGIVVVSDCKPD